MATTNSTTVTTPLYFPPWFQTYESFRAHVNALVSEKETAIRASATVEGGAL